MPNVIFKKIVVGILIGVGCLFIGLISCVLYRDFKMLMLSLIIASGMAIKSVLLYMRFKKNNFITITGVCSNVTRKLFTRYKTVEIITEEDKQVLYLPKDTKLSLNETYSFYFSKKPSDTTMIFNQYITSRLNIGNFLGYEKVDEEQMVQSEEKPNE